MAYNKARAEKQWLKWKEAEERVKPLVEEWEKRYESKKRKAKMLGLPIPPADDKPKPDYSRAVEMILDVANTLCLEENTKDIIREELYTEDIDLEFTTVYVKSDKFELGTIQIEQEGRDGKQVITRKKTFVNDELISDKAVGNQILKPAADKIVAIGTKQKVSDSAVSSSNALNFNMSLNKPSGLSLAQFEKIFANNANDKKGIMKDNAKYFYYAEQQYNVNGIFLAAVAIHESNWGTSAMSQNKKNLFRYGAYDRAPSENAYSFGTYAEGIDMLARVFAKYYLNPKGTAIYNGEVASGNYYNGSTLTGVNTKYASDKNWANAVYKWMQYLYNKF